MSLPKRLPKPTAILFDWDNTLVDTWPIIHQALTNTLNHMGHEPWPLEKVMRDAKRSMRDYFPDLFGERADEAVKHYQQSYVAIHLEHLKPLVDVEDMLKQANKTGAFVALVSNKRGPTLRKELENLGWTHYFKAAIGADDAEFDKPHIAPAIMAMEGSGIAQGEHIWFIGDTGVDLECAKNLGATPILYGEHETDGRVHDGFPYAYHVRNHKELTELLKQHV